MSSFVVTTDDPGSADVRALLDAHLAFARAASPPEVVHALDVTGLRSKSVSFFSIRRESPHSRPGDLLGVGALRELNAGHAELKSMHTTPAARGRGVARAMLDHLLSTARARGYERVSLETGSMAAFAPARSLYATAGFTLCEPFGDYQPTSYSVCMTLRLSPADAGRADRH